MSTYRLLRELHYRPRPLTYSRRKELYELLAYWYTLYKSLPAGGYTDLCEVFEVHPREMRSAIELYHRIEEYRIHGRSRMRFAETISAIEGPTIWDQVKPTRGFHASTAIVSSRGNTRTGMP